MRYPRQCAHKHSSTEPTDVYFGYSQTVVATVLRPATSVTIVGEHIVLQKTPYRSPSHFPRQSIHRPLLLFLVLLLKVVWWRVCALRKDPAAKPSKIQSHPPLAAPSVHTLVLVELVLSTEALKHLSPPNEKVRSQIAIPRNIPHVFFSRIATNVGTNGTMGVSARRNGSIR